MKPLMFILAKIFLVSAVFGKSTSNAREPRWFGQTYTETKVQREIVTSLVPSSCVQVEATLPLCRSVRNMQSFPEFVGTRIFPEHIKGRQIIQQPTQITGKDQQQIVLAPVNETKAVGWAEYLGLVGPTVTVTAINLYTTTMVDPRTVVTFSVKGCKPSRLPMDLDRCPISQYSIEEVLPTSVMAQISPTATARALDLNENDIILNRFQNMEIEPSPSTNFENLSHVPTRKLPNVKITL